SDIHRLGADRRVDVRAEDRRGEAEAIERVTLADRNRRLRGAMTEPADGERRDDAARGEADARLREQLGALLQALDAVGGAHDARSFSTTLNAAICSALKCWT